jgi:hypothetical protein
LLPISLCWTRSHLSKSDQTSAASTGSSFPTALDPPSPPFSPTLPGRSCGGNSRGLWYTTKALKGETFLAAAIVSAGDGGSALPPNGGGLGGAPCRASPRGGNAARDARRRVDVDGRGARVRRSYGVVADRSLLRPDSSARCQRDLGRAGLDRAALIQELRTGRDSSSARANANPEGTSTVINLYSNIILHE